MCRTKEDEDEDLLGYLQTTQDEAGGEDARSVGEVEAAAPLEERGEKEDGLKAAWRTRAENPTSAWLRLGWAKRWRGPRNEDEVIEEASD